MVNRPWLFVLGLSAFGDAGLIHRQPAADRGARSGLSDLLVGLLLLSIAVFAPWLTWRFVHWSGIEAGNVLHSVLAASPVPGAARAAGPKVPLHGQSVATTALLGAASGGAAGASGRQTPQGSARAPAHAASSTLAGPRTWPFNHHGPRFPGRADGERRLS